MNTVTPEWFTYKGASQYCGLSIRKLEELVKERAVVSSNLKDPGNSRGRRLIKRISLDEYIEAGIEAPPSESSPTKGRKLSPAARG